MKFEIYLTKLILLLSQVKASNLYLECSCLYAQDRNSTAAQTSSEVVLNASMARHAKNGCYLIFIVGTKEEIVTFRFKKVQLRPHCLDYIEIFPYLREPVVENITMAEYMYCNYSQSFVPSQPTPSSNFDSINDKRLANLSSTTQIHITTTRPMFLSPTHEFIYSSHRILAIRVRFNKSSLPGAKRLINNWPLQLTGEYRFLKKEHFQNDGRLIKNSYCDYYFFANPENSYEALKVWKYFHSPRFPAKYPAHIKCFYKFIGRRNSHVQVSFEEINIPKGENGCDLDKLIIYDSESANTNKIVDVLCDFPPSKVFLSSGPDLVIEFNASSNTTAKGFRGKFRFLHNEVLIFIDTQRYVNATESNQNRIPDYENEKIRNTQGDCKFMYDSNLNKTGIFDTNQLFTIQHIRLAENNILFRAVEPIECTYEFYGQREERVQIKFLDFNIPSESQNSPNCYANNSLQLLTDVRGSKYEVTDMYCGRFLPKPIMSKGTKLALQFVGKYPISQYDDNGKGIYYGFKAEYRFLTNYGVISGHQLGYDCIFTYNSTKKKSGLFMSPNFPGFYPQNIICHFYFYGDLQERILIQFDIFDVEGIGSCEYLTASDYVEFSNFMSTDRKYRKFCGKREKFNIRSDDRFFRVSLYTNDRFDRSGFRAYYSFESKAKSSDNTSAQGFMISHAKCSKLTAYFQINRLIFITLLCSLY
ncbi:suppressor of lurcher protein 1 [Glossina fuscipes]|uniref:Suppressor of lurcher protein 1 n=1 Tax=Glossina fuscipes TaxID=7396 RepID=A0A8U0WHW2_9MUSC|nr:suppressor of lurcher protein 1 [Glossina fuscipes]